MFLMLLERCVDLFINNQFVPFSPLMLTAIILFHHDYFEKDS